VSLCNRRLVKGVLVPGSNASQAIAKTAFADANGRTLYTYDKDAPGVSNCVGECTAAFQPLAAPADAKVAGDWSVIVRDDGAKQWAHEGQPLYMSPATTWTGFGTRR
jgi:predicted lipoprotein with Yx(FWY)xxD motif